MKKPFNLTFFAVQLGMLVALTPFAIDTYLPAIPELANDLQVPTQQISITIPMFLIGFALGQLFGGPLSDRFGRKIIASIGLMGFGLSSIGLVWINDVSHFYLLRVLQALGGGFATVVAGAMVRDLFSGRESAKVLSMMAMVMLIAPLIAPAIGALILLWHTWHGVFLFLVVYAFAIFFLLNVTLNETLTPHTRTTAKEKGLLGMMSGYATVLKNRRSVGFLLGQGFASSVLFVYITESSFIYMEYFGVSASAFPFYFGVVVMGVMFFNRMNVNLLKRYDPAQILIGVVLTQLLLALILLGYVLLTSPSVYGIILIQFFLIGMLGMVTPNLQACYLEDYPDIAGTANALNGTSIFAMGGVMGVVISLLHDGSLVMIVSFLGIMLVLSLMALMFLARIPLPNWTGFSKLTAETKADDGLEP